MHTLKKQRFPILKNVEYCSIFKNGVSMYESDGSELENLSWRDLQLLLGEKIPIDNYNYTIKFKGKDEIHNGKIRAASLKEKPKENIMDESKLLNEIRNLKTELTKAEKTGGISYDLLIATTKSGHDAEVSFLNQKIADKQEKIQELKKENDELDEALKDCQKESAKNSGITQWLTIGEKVASIYMGKGKNPVSLKESNTSDIPEQILIVLGVIDWNKIDAESITRIATQIQNYLSLIPKEYFKGT